MNWHFYNKQQSLTGTAKQAGVGKLFDWSKKFTGHMFNIKLEENSYNMSFKALSVKYNVQKTGQGGGGGGGIMCLPPGR